MKKNKTENKNNLIFTRETLGMTVLLCCLVVFIALLSYESVFAGFGGAICTFMYGTFGYGCFLVLALFACLGVWLTFERRIKLKFLPALFLSLTVYMLFLLFHAVSTNGSDWQTDGYPISDYIAQCYLVAKEGFPYYTLGGVLSAVLVYPVALVTTYIGAYIIFSILALLCGYFTIVFFRKSYGKAKVKAGNTEGAEEEQAEQPAYDERYGGAAYAEPMPAAQPVQGQFVHENYGYSPQSQQYSAPSYPERYSERPAPVQQPLYNTRPMTDRERDEEKFDPAKLGRQILFGNDFAAESYRRNGIFDENSYFNHPIRNDGDYIRGFSDGKSRPATDYGTTYSSAFEQSVESQPPAQHGGILYGDAPADKLGDGQASSYTAPESVHNYQDDEPSEEVTDYANSVYDAPETDFYQSSEEEEEDKPAESAPDFASSNPYDITRAAAPLPEENTFGRGEQVFGTVQNTDRSEGRETRDIFGAESDISRNSAERRETRDIFGAESDISRNGAEGRETRDIFGAESDISRNGAERRDTRDIFGAESDISRNGAERRETRDIFGGERELPSEGVGRRDRFEMFGTSSPRTQAAEDEPLHSWQAEGESLSADDSPSDRDAAAETSRESGADSLSSLFGTSNQRLGESRIEPDMSRMSRMESRANVFDDGFSDDVPQPPARGEEEPSGLMRGGREFIAPEPELPARQEPSPELSARAMPSRTAPVPAAAAPTAPPAPAEKKPHVWKKYVRPSLDLLDDYPERTSADSAEIEDNKRIIVETLQSFKIDCEISDVIVAPALTRYDVTIFDRTNIKATLLKYKDPIAMALKRDNVNAYLNFTKGALSIEVPNAKRTIVGLKGMMLSSSFTKAKSNTLTFALGKNLDGACICPDIRKMPHLLVAGTSGSGKSICLSSLLISLLYKYGPEDLRLILVDPKQVEFISYDKLPHLMINEIIFDVDKAIKALNWAIKEMERRYTLFKDMTETGARAKDGVKTATKEIDEYNAHIEKGEEKLPKILIVLDEFGDLMLSAKKDIEGRIIKLVQKGRAAGIHLILATQRPSVDCITGLIKSNLDARIGFKVGSFDDSRTIFDIGGAEKLLGKGDMYFRSKELAEGKMQRIQGCFVDTPEVQRVTDFIKANNETCFDQSISDFINTVEDPDGASSLSEGGDSNEDIKIDDTFLRALKYCVSSKAASVSMIQRRFPIGYIKACKIVDWMEKMDYITSSEGSKSRKVLLSMDEFISKYGEVDD